MNPQEQVAIEIASWVRAAEAATRDKLAKLQLGEAFSEQRPWQPKDQYADRPAMKVAA